MKRKNIIRTIAGVALVAVAAVAGASFYMLDYSLYSDSNRTSGEDSFNYFCKTNPSMKEWGDSLKRTGTLRDTFIVMPDNSRQHAIFARSPQAAGRTALLVHGYGDCSYGMLHIASIYSRVLGYNIILPDLHAHGQSDGNDIQMGWKDRLDVLHWISLAPEMFGTTADSLRLVVHGISMGAATTMCVSGEQTPRYVKCFVEDCGYTSVWDEFSNEISARFSLPDFPLMYTASWVVKAKYGWGFNEASPLKQVAKCQKPMLFIHGDNDTFVPTWMVYPLYEAKPQPKALWIAHGSKHADAYADYKEEYARRVVGFVEKYL